MELFSIRIQRTFQLVSTYQGKIRYEIGESGKQNRAGRMPEKYS